MVEIDDAEVDVEIGQEIIVNQTRLYIGYGPLPICAMNMISQMPFKENSIQAIGQKG